MTTEWKSKCKDCGAEFAYSDTSYQWGAERGLSRAERCSECRRAHNLQTSVMAVPYLSLRPRLSAKVNSLMPGPLGALSHPVRPHVSYRVEPELEQFDFTMNDDHVRRLVDILDRHQVAVVVGPTGSGKSTFLPFRLIQPPEGIPEDRFTRYGQVVVTQPRIQATRNIPAWVAKSLLGSNLGSGFDVGFRHSNNPYSDWRNRLVYLTDGTLVNWITNGDIANLSLILIDEAHERSVTIDVILGLLKRMLPRYPNLKLVIASATIDSELFLKYFGASPDQLLLCEEARKFTLREVFRGDENKDEKPLPYGRLPQLLRQISEAMTEKILEIARTKPAGDILGFLHSVQSITEVVSQLRTKIEAEPNLRGITDVYPLYTNLPQGEQNKALLEKPDPTHRRIVITTNVAETSLTVPDVKYVVDSGLIYLEQWDEASENKGVIASLHSRAGCRQRMGRAGRTDHGEAHCLYTHEQFDSIFPAYTPAQIQRSSLEKVVLATKAAGIDALDTFDWIEMPPSTEVDRAQLRLRQRGALDAQGDLTEHGLELLRFSDEPALAHLMILADRFGCAVEMATILAVMKAGRLAHFFEWSEDWDPALQSHVSRVRESFLGACVDDIELCLKLYTAWSESDDDAVSFAPSGAFAGLWPSRVPTMPQELRESLDANQMDAAKLLANVAECSDLDELARVRDQMDGEIKIDDWMRQVARALPLAKRECWARAFFVNHSLMKEKVEPVREDLLNALSVHKKQAERRPINFDLLDKVRILFAYALPLQIYSTIADGTVVPVNTENVDNGEPRGWQGSTLLNNDSACFANAPQLFAAGKRQIINRRLAPGQLADDHLHLSFIARLEPHWLAKIPRSIDAAAADELALADFIASETRDRSTGMFLRDSVEPRLFLDQNYPVGARFLCRIVDRSAGTIVIGRRVADPPEMSTGALGVEMSDGEGDEDDIREGGDLVDNVISEDNRPTANPDEGLEDERSELLFGEDGIPVRRAANCSECGSTVRMGALMCSTCLANSIESFDAASLGYARGRLNLELARRLEELCTRACSACRVITPALSATCSRCGDPLGISVYLPSINDDTIVAQVESHEFGEVGNGTVLFTPVLSDEAFERFASIHDEGGQVPVLVQGVVSGPSREATSLLVRDISSGLEIAIGQRSVTASGRRRALAHIPGDVVLWPVIEGLDEELLRVSLSLIPIAENHLMGLMGRLRPGDDGTLPASVLEVGLGARNHMWLLFKDSDPAIGALHVLEASDRGLARSIGSYSVGEELEARISMDQRPTYARLAFIPESIKSKLGHEGSFRSLSWDGEQLVFDGLMTYSVFQSLVVESDDAGYRRAISVIYRNRQPRAEVSDVRGWQLLASAYPLGSIASVTVLRQARGGLVVRMADGPEVFVRDQDLPKGQHEDGIELELMVTSINPRSQRIGLGQITEAAPPLKEGDRFLGRVTGVRDFGLFVEIRPGVSGLVYKTEFWGFVTDPGAIAQQDDTVLVAIKSITDKIALTMKLPENDPLLDLRPGQVVKGGRVNGVKDFGAFVDVAPGVSGLLHVNTLGIGRANAHDHFTVGDTIDILIEGIDVATRDVRLRKKD